MDNYNPQENNCCPPDTLSITPLGGLGEIGLNMMALEYGNDIIVIDAGLMFPEDYMLGIDVVIPDTVYLEENKDRILGIILTHGHEDHIGALPFVLKNIKVPVYGAGFTLELVKNKLSETGWISRPDLREIRVNEVLHIGVFRLEPIRVCHSIVDCFGLAITTPVGTVVHSGDFKIDPAVAPGMRTDLKRFSELGRQGVLALLSDSTNVERKGHSLSERDVEKSLDEIFSGCNGRIIMALFASHIQRIQQVVNLSARHDRKVVFNGKSIITAVGMAKDLGFLNIPAGVEIDIGMMERLPDKRITLVTTGSQAEPLASITRMAFRQHKQIVVREPDTVIFSSRFIPGNVRAITRIINLLYRQGADVIYETVSDIHASGHAYQDELDRLIKLIRPKYLIPIHGEYRHLVQHGRLAKRAGIDEQNILVAENGKQIWLNGESAVFGPTIPTGRVLVDGKGIGDVDSPVLKDRRRLSEDGMMTALVVVDEESGELLAPPEIITRGFTSEGDEGEILEMVRELVFETFKEINPSLSINWVEVSEELGRKLRKVLFKTLERRPVVLPVVVPI